MLEQIDNADLVKHGKVNKDAVDKMSVFDIIEFAQKSKELTVFKEEENPNALFSHSASASLSGSAWPCGNLSCRLEQSESLAQYAAFYSDKVYIKNFIIDHLNHLQNDNPPNEDVMKCRFYSDLCVMQNSRPLIENGLIVPISFRFCCPDCFVQQILDHESEEKLAKVITKLSSRYHDELNYTVFLDEMGMYNMKMEGPDDLLDHGYMAHVSPDPFPCITHDKKIRKKVEKGKKVKVPKSWIEKMELDIILADDVFQNAEFSLRSSEAMGSHFVTDRQLEISTINDLTNNIQFQKRNSIIQQHLNAIVPFLNHLTPEKILKIRKNEEEAFVRFRQSLNQTIKECDRLNLDEFTKQDAINIYQEILRPEIERLNQVTKSAHKSVLKGTTYTAAGYVAAIAFGYFTGLMPDDLLLAAKALGITKVVADLVKNSLNAGDANKDLKNSQMYFLWKLEKESRKK